MKKDEYVSETLSGFNWKLTSDKPERLLYSTEMVFEQEAPNKVR